MGDGYVLGTATDAGLPLKTMGQKREFNKRLREMGVPLKLCGTCGKTLALGEFAKDSGKSDGLRSHCRACQSAERAKYNEEHRKERQEYDAKYRAENREKLRDYFAKYNAERREEQREYFAKYRAENREKRQEYNDEYRAANSARPLDIGDAHLKKRCAPETSGGCGQLKTRGDFHRSRSVRDQRHYLCRDCAARRNANSGYRKACRQAHGEPEATVCHLCGLPNDSDAWVDHLHPQSLADEYTGDIHEASNLRWAHAVCNISRGNKPLTSTQLARIYGEAA